MPYLILLTFLAGLTGGWFFTSEHYEANQAAAERAAVKAYKADVERGNTESGKLAAVETVIQIKTVERIKYVPQVTTGKPCLSASAVQLLNGTDKPTLRETTGQPPAESAGAPEATDTDVETWAIEASGQYESCAARLNALIDFEEGRP
ncbi:MAG: hypothetical protein KJ958_05500 [Gammaproteobacteria bacterium]|nr:hypothetical protein [Gammaproteobacteria bacterium]MBU1978609.1 hypothetical protein [Gammaproteobacteria bacterium]